jgi:hypothetical protein
MTAEAPIAGVPSVIIARQREPPLVMLCRQSSGSSYTDVRLGLFLYRDVSLCLPTGVGHQFPPRQ